MWKLKSLTKSDRKGKKYKAVGALSRWLLWNKPTLKASLADFKKRFGV